METALIIIGGIVFVGITFILYRLSKVKKQNKKLERQRFERIMPLYNKLESGQDVTPEDILPFAANLLTRCNTFQLLDKHSKAILFPKEYSSIVKAAESSLANWLEYPTELDACPDEIEHVKRVTLDFDGGNNFVHYEVFKYKVNDPHWASKEGWILGVVGPYFDDSSPYDFPSSTFSRISSTVEKVSPDAEVKWVHENISMRK